MTRRRATHPDQSAMGAALMRALASRVAKDPAGQIVLPVGVVDAADVGRVLEALDRCKEDRA